MQVSRVEELGKQLSSVQTGRPVSRDRSTGEL